MQDTIKRINELAKKAKEVGLTQEELEERDRLRRIYINSVKGNLVAHLSNTYMVDEHGNKTKVQSKNQSIQDENSGETRS